MLWKVENFKSIKSACIDLQKSQVSVIAGTNSSGKSSIIQSLLMVAQSNYRSIDLNGHLVSLGTPEDVIRDGSDKFSIEYSYEGADYFYEHDKWKEAKKDYKVRVTLKEFFKRDGTKTLGVVELKIDEDNLEYITTKKISRRPNRHNVIFDELRSIYGEEISFVPFDRKRDEGFTGYIIFQGFNAVAVGYISNSSHDSTSSMESHFKKFLRDDFNNINEDQVSSRTGSFYGEDLEERHNFISILNQSIADPEFPKYTGMQDKFDSAVELYNAFNNLKTNEKRNIYAHIAEKYIKKDSHFVPINNFFGMYHDLTKFKNEIILNKFFQSISKAIKILEIYNMNLNFLSTRIKYLGPLRSAPRAYHERYNLYSRRNSPIGVNGEGLASYLASSESLNKKITYTNPQGISVESSTIDKAINEWMNHMNIGENIKVKSIGKIGYDLTLEVNGHRRDLTAVGVGVSQSLPVIVALLACEPGDIFIVEQPELHLHPDAQADLADFLATARPDVCVVLETHSDNILTRIRRRVVEGKIDKENINIIFVSTEEGGNISTIIPVNDMGKLDYWPKGFLNGTIDDSRAMFLAERELQKKGKEETDAS